MDFALEFLLFCLGFVSFNPTKQNWKKKERRKRKKGEKWRRNEERKGGRISLDQVLVGTLVKLVDSHSLLIRELVMHNINVCAINGANGTLSGKNSRWLSAVDSGDFDPISSPGNINQAVECNQSHSVRGLTIRNRVFEEGQSNG